MAKVHFKFDSVYICINIDIGLLVVLTIDIVM